MNRQESVGDSRSAASCRFFFLEPFAHSEPNKSNPVSQGEDDALNMSNPPRWRRRVRNFTRAVRARARGFNYGSEWSPHLSRGVSTTDQNSLEPSICKGASIRSPRITTCRGYARPNGEPCVTRALKLEPCVARLDRPSKIRTLRCSRAVKSALGRWRPKKKFLT